MQIPFGWARRPLLERVGTDLDSRIPITFIYGTRSWMDNKSGSIVKAQRQDSYVDIHFIHGAGHHVHAEQPEAFNSYVKKIFAVVETGQDLLEPAPSLNASLWTHNSMSKWFCCLCILNSVIVTKSLSYKVWFLLSTFHILFHQQTYYIMVYLSMYMYLHVFKTDAQSDLYIRTHICTGDTAGSRVGGILYDNQQIVLIWNSEEDTSTKTHSSLIPLPPMSLASCAASNEGWRRARLRTTTWLQNRAY